MKKTRREILEWSATAALASCTPTRTATEPVATRGPMPMRALGKTGESVTLFSLGGQATLQEHGMRDEAIDIVTRALDLGVRYFDTSKVYGPSEDYLGEALANRRSGVVLATKTHDRTRDGSLRLLDDSLRRLRTDHVDVWQLHDIRTMVDVEHIFGAGGVIEAIEAAKKDGRTRFAGITGHADPDVLIECIRRYPFDTLLLALNVADPHIRSFQTALLPLAVDRGMGIIAMKVNAAGLLTRDLGFDSKDTLSYVLGLPISTAIIGCDNPGHVEANAAIARSFTSMSANDKLALERRAKTVAENALYFRSR